MTPQHKQALEELRDWMVKWGVKDIVAYRDIDEETFITLNFPEEEKGKLNYLELPLENGNMVTIDSINTLLKEQE